MRFLAAASLAAWLTLNPLQVLAAQQQVIFVNHAASGLATGSSWRDAIADLQLALDLAVPGTQIWVAEGTYLPDSGTKNQQLSFELRDGVELYGGFAGTESMLSEQNPAEHPTILSGDLNGDDIPGSFAQSFDNSRHVVRGEDVDDSALVDGLVIQSALQVGSDTCGPDPGGAISLLNAHARFRRCVIRENRGSFGAGCHLGSGSAAVFENCLFEDNVASLGGGGAGICDSSPTFTGCEFRSNHAPGSEGGGVCVRGAGASPLFQDCRFVSNEAATGGALAGLSNSRPSLDRCVVVGNSAVQGGGVVFWAAQFIDSVNGSIRNSYLYGNAATGPFSNGGAIFVLNSSSQIDYCTIVGNSAPQLGAGITIAGLVPEAAVKNSIIWGNTCELSSGTDAQVYSFSTESFGFPASYSCIEGWTGALEGAGNIGLDPALTDLDGEDDIPGTTDDNIGLQPDSPCVDAGQQLDDISGIALDGTPRVIDGDLDGLMLPDMGACEFSNVRLQATATTIDITSQADVVLWGFLIAGLADGDVPVAPFGALLVDPTYPLNRTLVGPLPVRLALSPPSGIDLPRRLKLQALGIASGSFAGNFSAAVWVDLGD